MKADEGVAADVAPLCCATRLNPIVRRINEGLNEFMCERSC